MSTLPFTWHAQELVVVVLLGVAHQFSGASKKQRIQALSALGALLVATVWPVGDIAANVSLSVATVQRLVLMLLVAPLLLMSVPATTLAKFTKPRAVDFFVRLLGQPGVALGVVLVLGTLTLSAPVVDAGARSPLTRDLTLVVVIVTGLILWAPALGVVVGGRKLSPVARGGYLFGSSLVVTSLSFIWIFARHPLYPALHHQRAIVHLTPLFDQQLAGFLAKGLCYFPMWAVAFVIFSRADKQGVPVEESPLYWADVERQLLRVDRQRERALRRGKLD